MDNKKDTSTPQSYELVNFCEFDKFAEQSYCAVHGVDARLNLGDITKVDETKIKPFSMICGGSPCFVEGTLVLTENGYMPIEKIVSGDKVITHKNRYMKVVKSMINETNKLVGFRTSVSEMIYCTPEHPIYIREHQRSWNTKTKGYDRVFDAPIWRIADEISVGNYVGTAINQKEELPKWDGYFHYKNQYKTSLSDESELNDYFSIGDFWYLVGRYIGDGWLNMSDEKSIIICCKEDEVTSITNRLNNIGINYSITKQSTVIRIQITKKELHFYLRRFGHGVSNKHLTKDVLNLPVDLLREFLSGYIDSDGTFTQGRYKATSVSRRLIYEIGECVAKVYHRPYSIYFTERPKTYIIEGRVVNQKDTYQICWKPTNDKQDKSFYEDGYIWSPITKVVKEDLENELVYNLEIEDDNSYMVQGVIVHNCQDFSVAGKGEGSKWKCKDCGHEYNPLTVHYSSRHKCPKCGSENLDKTRSSLLVEWLRVIRANKPKWGIYENVKNIVGAKFKETFQMFLDELHEYGYNTYYKILNAKDFGIPQNRERVYLIIILKELDNGKFKFPQPFESSIRLKDILEDEVDEKYYINTPTAQKLIDDLIESGKLDKEISNTVRAGGERKCRPTSMGYGSSLIKTGIFSQQCQKFDREIDVANTLLARDYKGFGNQGMNGVITKYEEN